MFLYGAVVCLILVYAGAMSFFFWTSRKKLKLSQSFLKQQKEECDQLILSNSIQKEKLHLLEEQKKKDENKLKDFEKQMTLHFENLSQKIFNEKSSQFKKDSKEQIAGLLDPVKEKIKEFQDKVEKHYGLEAQERFSLRNEIEKMAKMGEKMRLETDQLTQALKGNAQSQGAWGEVILNRVLTASGLREGEEYEVQGKGMDLRSETGQLQKPDVVVNLPQKKHLVIDSKVSLTHYLKWTKAENSEDQSQFLKLFVQSIRKHITDLSTKNYAHALGLQSLDFVFMFFPLEGAFSTALQTDSHITDFAWKQSIVVVSPTTLLATLRTVAFIWQRERESKNVLEISKKAGSLYDKFVGFSEDLKHVGGHLEKSTRSYEQAYNKLCSGKGNIVSRLEEIKRLGARAEKNIDFKEKIEQNTPIIDSEL